MHRAAAEADAQAKEDVHVASEEAPAAEASRAAREVVVFDFDGTLVSRDSFLDFSLRYCAQRLPRLLLVVTLLPLALLVALRSRANAGSVLLWAMTFGASTRAFAQALRRYAQLTLPGYARDAIFAELARHVAEGSRVVIATGTSPLIVRGLFAARKLGRLPIVGSRFRRRWGGLVVETHCIGRTKRLELQRRLGIVEWASVYTDSIADRSLIKRARDITLVSPSRRTLLRTQRSIASRTTTLRVLHLG